VRLLIDLEDRRYRIRNRQGIQVAGTNAVTNSEGMAEHAYELLDN